MKKNKRKSDFRWRKEVTLLPSYIIGIIWAFFTIFMIGWIIAASLSSTKEVFTGNVLSTGYILKIILKLSLEIKH